MAPMGWRIPVWNTVMNEETATPAARPVDRADAASVSLEPPGFDAGCHDTAARLALPAAPPAIRLRHAAAKPELGHRDHPRISPSQSACKA